MTDSLKLVRGFKVAYPIFIERSYKRQLVGLVRNLELLTLELLFESHYFHNSFNKAIRKDDIIDDFEDLIRKINATIVIEVNKTVGLLPKRFEAVRSFVERSFSKSLAHIQKRAANASISTLVVSNSSAIATTDIALLRRIWAEKNTQLIKSIPADALVKVSDVVHDAIRQGESRVSLGRKLSQVFKTTKKRANMIARDQIGKAASDLNRHNDLVNGLNTYEWSTCLDGAVRPSHRALNGKICSWNDPTIFKNKLADKWKKRASINAVQKHAGEDFNCRCTNLVIGEIA